MHKVQDFSLLILNTLLNDKEINKKDNYSLEIEYVFEDTESKRKQYVLGIFSQLYKITNSDKFDLIKINNNLYKNYFFELKYDSLKFIGVYKDILINELKNLDKEVIFVPNSYKDYALIHETHNKTYQNSSITTVILTREDLSVYNSKSLKSLVLNESMTFEKNDINLIIVENYKIFEKENLIEYFENFEINLKENEKYIVMYGSGNKINSYKNINFLNSYKEIFYFGDYDDEGFKIFNMFNTKVPNSNFILPKKEIIDIVQKRMGDKDIIKIRKENNCFIKNQSLLSLLGLSNSFEMQQEVFLN